MKLDAHHHFWAFDPIEYGWIGEEMRGIRRDFLPADLELEINAAGIEGVISVQARQSVEETEWLLEFAGQHNFIKGVVGWVPLVSERVSGELERYAANPKFKGVRHVLQGEPDEHYLRREDFNAGIRALKAFDLVYDLLIVERQLPQTIEFVDRHPEQTFVLDHLAKPRIAAGEIEPWREHIRNLARRENVCCKLSGMVTEANWQSWSDEHLRPFVDAVLEAFGPARMMFGSDWPVCLVASGYARWVQTVERLTAQLSGEERAQVFGGTAARIYRIS